MWGRDERGKELGVDVGENSSLGDDDGAEETVELLVVPDGELQVTGNDSGLLVVTGRKQSGWSPGKLLGGRLTERRFQRARGSQLRGTRGRRRGRLGGNAGVSREDDCGGRRWDSPGAPAPTRWA
jgi:hypothetical protein